MDAGNFFAGLSSSDDSTHHHHHHHALGMVISFTVLACGIMLEDSCGPIAGTIILVLVGLMDGLSITMKLIGDENAKNLEEMTPAASGSHRATDQGKKTPFISLSSPFLERIDFEDTSMDGLSITMKPTGNENAKNLEEMTPAASGSHRATDQGKKTPFISLSSPFLERIDFEDTSMDGLSITMKPTGNENAKNLEEMTPPASGSHRAADQGKKTPFISFSPPFLESKMKSENIDSAKELEKPSNLVVERKRKSESIDSRKGHKKRLSPVFESKRKSKIVDSGLEKRSNPVLESKRKSENIDSRKELEKPSNLVVESKKKPESIDSRKGHKKPLSPVFEGKRKSKIVDSGLEKQSNPVLESKRKSEHIDPRKDLEKPSNLVVESKRKPESTDSRKGHKKPLSPVFESKRKSKIVDSGLEKRSNPVLESKRKSEHIDLSKGPEKRLRPVVEGKMKSENIGSRKGHVKRFNLVVESKKKSNNIDLGKEHETRLRPAVESKKKSENTDLRCKQDKKVVGTHRTSPCFAPAHRDASAVVRSGFVRPTLIRDGKSIGYENRQGKDKQLSSVMESKRKSEKADLNRKQDKNVVNMHRMIPHVVSASLSEFVQPTSISKGSKPIESQKHKGHEKRLIERIEEKLDFISMILENRRKSEHIGLVRKHKQVVGTQRTITGVVPAQGHIPVVRSGLVRPTLIQKDSKSIGSEKLQGSEKLLSSFVESKKKSGNIDSMRKNDKKVVGTRKDLVDEKSLQLLSKQKNVKAVPQVPAYKGRKINFTSELKTGWKF